MTPLPKHLEEMRQFWIDKEQDIDVNDDENFYGYACDIGTMKAECSCGFGKYLAETYHKATGQTEKE